MFPEKSYEWAFTWAESIRKEYGKKKRKLAEGVFRKINFQYGFKENLETGNYVPWPHEGSYVVCQTGAADVFLVAKLLELDPKLYAVTGLRDQGEPHGALHFFVTVDVGASRPVIVDPIQNLFGFVDFDKGRLRITRFNYLTGYHNKRYSSVVELSEEDYCKKVEFQKTPEGKLTMLIEGQKMCMPYRDGWKSRTSWSGSWMIQYHPEESVVESRMNFSRLYLQYRILDVAYRIREGTVEEKILRFRLAPDYNWMDLQDPKHIASMPYDEFLRINPQLRALHHSQHQSLENIVHAIAAGSNQNGSGLEHLASELVGMARLCFADFVERATEKEKEVILAEAAYQRARNGGQVFSDAELDAQCVEEIKKLQQYFVNSSPQFRVLLHDLELKRVSHARSRHAKWQQKLNKQMSTVRSIHDLRKRKDRFRGIVDRYLFGKRLKKTTGDIGSAFPGYATLFTEFAVIASHCRNELSLRKHLPKVLAAIKESR